MANPESVPAVPEDDVPANEALQVPSPEELAREEEFAFHLSGYDNREHALPIRQGDLTRLLLAEPGLTPYEREKLEAFGKILGATFHSEYYDRLHELKELYAPLDPDSEYVTLNEHTREAHELSDEEFLIPFEQTMVRANYSPLDIDIIKKAVSAPNEMGLTYVPDFTLFEHLRVYVRGYTRVSRDLRSMKTRFKKRTARLDAYQRMVIALKFRPGLRLGPYVRSDVLYLRMFKDVPHVDMEMHLPEQGTKVRMRLIDKAQIASPLVIGLPTLLFKLLFASLTLTTFALGGVLIAPISAGVNSFFGFQRAKQRHLNEMIRRLYYLSLANNASVLTRLVDSAEDEDYKEAMLAYFFLWRATVHGKPLTMHEADLEIEQFIRERMGVEVNFDVADALSKLIRLGLVKRDSQSKLHAAPIDDALHELDRIWDSTFPYSRG
ncbi:DUF3754 domain-containing protein [Singulisphaera sp. PoT]|uniref:DUF3754 domain-containing protein n=1 Tax=Singulisphaera sp. PoT TaxID=3411797 RepID=UPI003BF5D3CF